MIRTGCRLHATVEEITALIASSKPAAPAGGGPQLQQYQTEMLGKLRALRDSLDAERAPFVKMQAERDAAVSAKATLEEANEKMAYRIKHLMRAIDPDDQIWERDAARNFGWFCWIYSASFSMAEVAVSDVSGDDDNGLALCVAL